jgi:hypothetical protein
MSAGGKRRSLVSLVSLKCKRRHGPAGLWAATTRGVCLLQRWEAAGGHAGALLALKGGPDAVHRLADAYEDMVQTAVRHALYLLAPGAEADAEAAHADDAADAGMGDAGAQPLGGAGGEPPLALRHPDVVWI